MTPTLNESDTSRTVQAGATKLHYHEAGEGAPVILLHGSGPGATGWSNFSPNIGHLSANFRVFAVDMPGWGASDAVTAQDRDHVRTVLDFMDVLELPTAALVGNSMGARTALNLAVSHADRLSHVVTMGAPSPGVSLFAAGDGPSEGLKALRQAYADPSPATMKKLVDIMAYDPAFATDELAAQRSSNASARPDHLRNFLAGAATGAPLDEQRLREVDIPFLLIHGRDDRVLSYEHSLRLVSLIPNSRLVLLNRCGHWAQLEHAAEFNRLVEQFLLHA
jgi:2-hydroxy-6-oxonona-2,4-dienedioate hydrolase